MLLKQLFNASACLDYYDLRQSAVFMAIESYLDENLMLFSSSFLLNALIPNTAHHQQQFDTDQTLYFISTLIFWSNRLRKVWWPHMVEVHSTVVCLTFDVNTSCYCLNCWWGFTRMDQFVSVLAMNNMFLGCAIVLFLDNTISGNFSTLLIQRQQIYLLLQSVFVSFVFKRSAAHILNANDSEMFEIRLHIVDGVKYSSSI